MPMRKGDSPQKEPGRRGMVAPEGATAFSLGSPLPSSPQVSITATPGHGHYVSYVNRHPGKFRTGLRSHWPGQDQISACGY